MTKRTVKASAALGKLKRSDVRTAVMSLHVVPHHGKWQVRRIAGAPVTKVFRQKRAAVQFARDLAASEGNRRVFVHGKDGRAHEIAAAG